MKLKQTLAVLAALSIIVLGALLPELTALRQDRQDVDTVLFSDVQGVVLQFDQYEMTRRETLAILAHCRDTVEIPPELTSLKRDKAERIAAAAVAKYADAGILLCDPAGDSALDVRAVLCYGTKEQSNVYWQVDYGDKKGNHMFTLVIDDRSGAVCSVEYADQKETYPVERMATVLRGFCRLHLTELGEEFSGWTVDGLVANAKSPQDSSYLATELIWEDATYGRTRITFFVNGNGFYTYFDRAAQ